MSRCISVIYIGHVVAEATWVAIQSMSAASAAGTENVGSRVSGPIMKQPTFDWYSKDKYAELRNFKLEVKNMLHDLI